MADIHTHVHPLIKEALSEAKTKLFNGQLINLRPKHVISTDDTGMSGTFKNPSPFSPRYEYMVNPKQGSIVLTKQNWVWKWKYENKIEKWNTGIYQSGLDFPEFCVCCMKPVEKYEIMQLSVHVHSIARAVIPNATQKEANLIGEAWFRDRYWQLVPFCGEHGLESRCLSVREKTPDRFVIGFLNAKYGAAFGEKNGLAGKWFSKSQLFIMKFLVPIMGFLVFCSVVFGGLLTYRGLAGKMGDAVKTASDVPVGISLLVGGIALGVYTIILDSKTRKGKGPNAK